MKILVGVTGGIAAYKMCELVSLAVKAGHDVRVVMTANATRFVGPISLEALSGNPVLLDTFAGAPLPGSTSAIDHISWAKWPDAVLVAPLSANTLGKLACGLADDALTTVLMAVPDPTPIVLAPASSRSSLADRFADWRPGMMRTLAGPDRREKGKFAICLGFSATSGDMSPSYSKPTWRLSSAATARLRCLPQSRTCWTRIHRSRVLAAMAPHAHSTTRLDVSTPPA